MHIYFQAMKIHSLFITINALLQAIVEMARCAKHRDAPTASVDHVGHNVPGSCLIVKTYGDANGGFGSSPALRHRYVGCFQQVVYDGEVIAAGQNQPFGAKS